MSCQLLAAHCLQLNVWYAFFTFFDQLSSRFQQILVQSSETTLQLHDRVDVLRISDLLIYRGCDFLDLLHCILESNIIRVIFPRKFEYRFQQQHIPWNSLDLGNVTRTLITHRHDQEVSKVMTICTFLCGLRMV